MPISKKESPQEETHRGYNEKTPAQPQGTFEPDSKKTDEKPPVKSPQPVSDKFSAKKI